MMFAKIWKEFEMQNLEDCIKEIKETIGIIQKHYKPMKFNDVVKHHNPQTIEDWLYIRDCISRELSYCKARGKWIKDRNYYGLTWSRYEKNKPVNYSLSDEGLLIFQDELNEEDNWEAVEIIKAYED